MTDYIIGREIVENWEIRNFELLECVKNGLIPYTKTGKIYNCPSKFDLKKRLKNIEKGIKNLEHPDFPENLSYWDKERLLYLEERPPEEILIELKKNKSTIAKKIELLDKSNRVKKNSGWYYCDPPDLEVEREQLLNDVMKSLFLKKDVINILGRPTKGSQDKIFDISKEKKVRYSTRVVVPKCRVAAEKIWEKDPDLAIIEVAGQILLSGIAKNKKGDYYTLERIQIWIRNLSPNPRPGRKPNRN